VLAPPVVSAPVLEGEAPPASANGQHLPPLWPSKTDNYLLAREALKAGELGKALEIMQREIARQRSGRGRFERKMQLVELCVEAGKDVIAQPFLDDMAAAIEEHKLDDWEDKEMVAAALLNLMKYSKVIQESGSEKQKLFERICRLDPVRALKAE
jgi:type VI secretion system protein ImpA